MRRFIAGGIRLALLGVALVVLALIGEGGGRACPLGFFPEEIQQWFMAQRSLGHPALGAIEPPHTTGLFVGRDFRLPYHTDDYGFHNTGPWPVNPEIVTLGDGMTFGYGVDESQSWVSLVAQAVAPRNQVLNLALIDAGPRQYARTYELFGTTTHPRIVLVGLSLTDDLQDAVLFDRWQHSGVGTNYRVWHASGGITGDWSQPLGFVHATLARYSLLYQLLRVSFMTERAASQIVWFPGGQYIQLRPQRLDATMAQAQPGQEPFTRVVEALAYLQVIARAYGTHVVVVFLPSKEEIYLPLRGAPVLDPGEPLREALAQRGIATLDLGPPFRQLAAKAEPFFFATSRYLNARGHILVARHVLQHLTDFAQTYGLRPWRTEGATALRVSLGAS
jgi:hypothetical protein